MALDHKPWSSGLSGQGQYWNVIHIAKTNPSTRLKSLMDSLLDRLPCRSNEITKVWSLFAETPYPAVTYIHGGPGCGKTATIRLVFNHLKIKYTVINVIECFTSRLFFEAILVDLLKSDPQDSSDEDDELMANSHLQNGLRCDNMAEFVEIVNNNREPLMNSVIVLDNAHLMLDSTVLTDLLPPLLRLTEFCGNGVISIVMLSQLVPIKFHPMDVICLHFPQYNQEQLAEILLFTEPPPSGVSDELYQSYINAFLSVFYRTCRDLNELRYHCRNYFQEYYEPVRQSELAESDTISLWRRIAPHFRAALDTNVYLRHENGDRTADQQTALSTHNLELPFYAKYLLIAAYLASHNPAKDDQRIFQKCATKKRKTLKDVKKVQVSARQLMMGSKMFQLDRLLAIFYALMGNSQGPISFNNHLLVQIQSLVEVQLLSAQHQDHLDQPKFKCNAHLDVVQGIAKQVGINLRKYLSDLCHQ